MREPLDNEEFVYLGPPPRRQWRQPQLGMRTAGRRCAVNNPHGFDYDVRAVSDPYLGGDSEVWIAVMSESSWYWCQIAGRDYRMFAGYAPAYLVWMDCEIQE